MIDLDTTDRREKILATALHLFSEHGYFNTSVHHIQKEADVSIGSIYHHFGNKEAIAKALFDHIEEKMTEAIREIIVSHDSVHNRCKAILEYLFSITEEKRDVMQYMLYAKHREFMPDEKPVCSSRPFNLMREIVADGIDQGVIRDIDPTVAAVTVFGGAIRLIFLRLDGVLENHLSNYLEECWESAWRGVKN